MVCNSCLRTVIVQAVNIGRLTEGRVQLRDIGRILNSTRRAAYYLNCKFTTTGKMMVDTGATAKQGPIIDMLPEKDAGYFSGGWKSEDGKLSCGYSSFRGKRASMEDFYDIKTFNINGQRVCLFGIFDGHGGSRAAEFLKEHLFENLMQHPQFMTNTKLAISETYQQTDMDFLESEKETYRDDGSTASTAVLVGNHLYVANVGDSRTVISEAGKAIPLSDDHKPNRSDERKRIESAGGVVMWAGTWRVGGVLAMSRAFGNRMLKQFVVAEPEIQDQEIDRKFELLVLASDGLWDVVPNEGVTDSNPSEGVCVDTHQRRGRRKGGRGHVQTTLGLLQVAGLLPKQSHWLEWTLKSKDAVSLARTEEEPEVAAKKLTDTAFSRGSADNITCIVVKFHHQKAETADPKHE